ncbi:hypothetical protein BRD03_14565 [Halobacteriales archaeon QS_9_68_17]|nr:MAG: hypothetical protein BRD03_14565 [Halobacteriales archaeon QS_9_68_17]
MAAEIEHLDDMIDRLETEARERWGERWRIDVTRWADETVDVVAVHSNGLVTDHDGDEKLHDLERLYTDGDGRIAYEHVHVCHEKVASRLEETVLHDPAADDGLTSKNTSV